MQDEAMGGINIAPLVDVCLVLVLVFMVTSSYLSKELIPLQVPKAVTARAEDRENITISISPTGGFALNEKSLPRTSLEPELKRYMKETGIDYVLIRADEHIPYHEVEYVMKLSKRLGAGRIAFATVPKAS